MSDNPEQEAIGKLVGDCVARLGEHVESVEILVTYRNKDGNESGYHKGSGNWYARYGQLREAMLVWDEYARIEARQRTQTEES